MRKKELVIFFHMFSWSSCWPSDYVTYFRKGYLPARKKSSSTKDGQCLGQTTMTQPDLTQEEYSFESICPNAHNPTWEIFVVYPDLSHFHWLSIMYMDVFGRCIWDDQPDVFHRQNMSHLSEKNDKTPRVPAKFGVQKTRRRLSKIVVPQMIIEDSPPKEVELHQNSWGGFSTVLWTNSLEMLHMSQETNPSDT